MTYLLFITLGLCAGYFIFIALIPSLFGQQTHNLGKVDIFSIIFIALLSLSSYFLVNNIADLEISNRVLHASGGFLAFMVCFLVTKNSKLNLNKVQFFVFCFMVVTTIGVANEITEFFLQHYFGFLAASSVEDTWLDLVSNTVGLLIAAVVFTPFINPDEKERF